MWQANEFRFPEGMQEVFIRKVGEDIVLSPRPADWSGSKKKANQAAVALLIRHLAVLDWPREAAEHYVYIRAELKRRDQLIGSNDLLIAAHARSIDATVVTNNVKDFGRVKGLWVENWMA